MKYYLQLGALLGGIALMAPSAHSAVFMCVDPATGKTSFTDHACDTRDIREEVKVEAANLESGNRYGAAAKPKTWRSEEDTRKTGKDFNASRRNLYDNRAVASQ